MCTRLLSLKFWSVLGAIACAVFAYWKHDASMAIGSATFLGAYFALWYTGYDPTRKEVSYDRRKETGAIYQSRPNRG